MAQVEKLVTPESEVLYPWIFKPNTKFDQDGVYSVNCLIEDTPSWTKLLQHLENRLQEYYKAQSTLAGKKLKLCPYKPWKESDDGKKVFVAKNNAIGKTKEGKVFECKPRVVGPDPTVAMTEDDFEGPLGSGTRAKIGFAVNLWHNDAQGVGLTARLLMVQVIKPVIYDGIAAFKDCTDPEGSGGFSKVLADWFKPKTASTTPAKKPSEVEGLPGIENVDEEFLAGMEQ
jgi:hypothetical protein